jgi:Rrf2 family nitric oxide-sensitive transcriptional repressor
MLPKTAEYGLRAVVWLAREPNGMQSADQISEATKVPRRYLHRVLQDLVKAGLVRSQSGPGGGYSLEKAPADITILDAVNATGGIERIRSCPLGLESHHELCPLHAELDKAYRNTEEAFSRATLVDVLAVPTSIPPLCEVKPRSRRSRKAAT